ncbi:TPA: antibiotic biosynthesis monooxygenase [Providencia alcalifaciens]|uniref:antibiotic biosynthesis monooxygenase n=1 Tax=Providencia alcalifaciens TaxID=126385 RepID=UPI0021E17CE9|nr:antibiotic biosynthesis monooxygenase [Providencia alcalifaciens]
MQYDLMAKENGYIVFEEWENAHALEMYQKSSHFKQLVEAIERDNAIFSVNFSEK